MFTEILFYSFASQFWFTCIFIRTIELKCIVCTQRCTACQWCIKTVSYMNACVSSINAAHNFKVNLMLKMRSSFFFSYFILYSYSYSDVMVFFLHYLFVFTSSPSYSYTSVRIVCSFKENWCRVIRRPHALTFIISFHYSH